MGSSGSLSCGAREVRFLCAWLGGARHCSRDMVGESHLKTRAWRLAGLSSLPLPAPRCGGHPLAAECPSRPFSTLWRPWGIPYFVVFVQSVNHVGLFATPCTACNTPGFLSFTISWSLLRLMSIKLVILSNHGNKAEQKEPLFT